MANLPMKLTTLLWLISAIPSSIQMPPTAAEPDLSSEGEVSSVEGSVDITKRGGGAVEFRTRPVSRIRKKTWLQCKRLKDENFITCDEDDEDGRFCCKILGLKRAKKPRRKSSVHPLRKTSLKSDPKVVSVGNHDLVAFNLDDLAEVDGMDDDGFPSDDEFIGKSYASPPEEFIGDMTSEWWSKEADYSYSSPHSDEKSSSRDVPISSPFTRRKKDNLMKKKPKKNLMSQRIDQKSVKASQSTMTVAARKRQLRRLQEKKQQQRLRQQNLQELLNNPMLDKRQYRQQYKRLRQHNYAYSKHNLFQGGHRRGITTKYGNQPRRRPNSRPKEHYGKITLMDSGDFIGIDELNKMKGMITDEQEADLRTEEDFKEFISKEEGPLVDEDEKLPVNYDRDNCADLKVPCRFVSDHPCCRFRMPVELVARVRAMDGSADLRWRSSSEEKEKKEFEPPKFKGPRAKAKARSLEMGWEKHKKTSDVLSPSEEEDKSVVNYTHTTSKTSVSVPRYSILGGPDVLSTILGTCWRLHYVKCPPIRGNSWKKGAQSSPPPHPCCMLVTNPAPMSPVSNRLSRWLRDPLDDNEHFT